MTMFQIEVLASNVRKANADLEFAKRRVRETQEILKAAVEAEEAAQKALGEATKELLDAAAGRRDPFEDFKPHRT